MEKATLERKCQCPACKGGIEYVELVDYSIYDDELVEECEGKCVECGLNVVYEKISRLTNSVYAILDSWND